MSAVVDDELVVAVDSQVLEADHESLEDRLGLEGDDAVQLALVVGRHDGAVDHARNVGEEALVAPFAQLLDGN